MYLCTKPDLFFYVVNIVEVWMRFTEVHNWLSAWHQAIGLPPERYVSLYAGLWL